MAAGNQANVALGWATGPLLAHRSDIQLDQMLHRSSKYMGWNIPVFSIQCM